eukprot:10358532-Lingulodinium_polyedra.AAC.1
MPANPLNLLISSGVGPAISLPERTAPEKRDDYSALHPSGPRAVPDSIVLRGGPENGVSLRR